jgi:hypothetical protein
MTDDTALLRRFLRTVRVATHTALAEYELTDLNRSARSPVQFRALAAKGLDGWRFPEDGLAAADGLIVATVERDRDGTLVALILQVQGAAGLDAWAGRSVRVDFGALAEAVTRFDTDGRARVALAALALAEDDLATFAIEPVDAL